MATFPKIPTIINPPSQAGNSWWVWIALVERDGGSGLVYGCAARSFHAPGWRNEDASELPGGGRLVVYQSTLTEDIFSTFRDGLGAGTVDTTAIIPTETIRVAVTQKRTIIQEALGQSGVRTLLHYTLPNLKSLVGTAEGALEWLLTYLQNQLNLPFKDTYAGHLGNFEIFDLHPWLDELPPFLIEIVPNPSLDRSGPQIMEICRSPEFTVFEHTVHFVGRIDREVILDRVIKLPLGERRVPVQVQEMLDQFDVRIFSEDGSTLLHCEQASFLNRIGFVLAPIGRQIKLKDDLSDRAASKSKALGAQASTVVVHSSQRSMVGAPAEDSWRKFAEDMEREVSTHIPKQGEDKWFPRGIEGEVAAIAHIKSLIDAGQITQAVLVDPWFGAEALQRLVLRLSSQNLQLTILTSWTDTDPDTGEDLAPTESPTARLEAALHKTQPFLTPRLRVFNVVNEKERAFHDRYLLLYPHEHPPKVFLLSNSINKLAGNWPFAMSLLAPDVSRQVQHYIEALCDGQDTTRGRPLSINFRWPPNAL
jgi:hypothetical protein